MRLILFTAVICVAMAVMPVTVLAENDRDWQFELAPFYLWAINIDGDLGVRNRSTTVQIEFSDVWDNLEGVFTARLNAVYRNKFGLVIDCNYLDLGTEKQKSVINTDVGFTSQILNLGGTYRLLADRHVLDAVAGIRHVSLESEVNFNTIGRRLERNEDWVDPIVGLRYGYAITDRWGLRLYCDIGGFGAASDFTWQGMGLIGFQPWRYVAIVGGYRAIGTDYETGSGADQFTYDAVVHGPLVGIDIRF